MGNYGNVMNTQFMKSLDTVCNQAAQPNQVRETLEEYLPEPVDVERVLPIAQTMIDELLGLFQRAESAGALDESTLTRDITDIVANGITGTYDLNIQSNRI